MTDSKNQPHYKCYLGLGSNLTNELGTPSEHISNAITALKNHPQVDNIQSSSLYLSKPYGVTDQPDFINAVVGLETDLSPDELLDFCQSLETQANRQRLRHWGERSLDVDILLYGDEVVNPLAEIAPNLVIQGTAIGEMPLSQDWTGLRLL